MFNGNGALQLRRCRRLSYQYQDMLCHWDCILKCREPDAPRASRQRFRSKTGDRTETCPSDSGSSGPCGRGHAGARLGTKIPLSHPDQFHAATITEKNYQRYIKNVSTIILILLLLTSSWRTSWVRSSAVVEHREVSSGSIALRIVQTPAKSKSFEQRSRRADSETSPRRLGTWTNLSVQVYKFNKVEWKVSSIIPPTMLL